MMRNRVLEFARRFNKNAELLSQFDGHEDQHEARVKLRDENLVVTIHGFDHNNYLIAAAYRREPRGTLIMVSNVPDDDVLETIIRAAMKADTKQMTA